MNSLLEYNKRELLRKLKELSPQFQAAFAAACAERLLLTYKAYSLRAGRGNFSVLDTALSRLWEDLSDRPMSNPEIGGQIEACMNLLPPDGETIYVLEEALAEDAVSATTYALRCRRAGKPEEAELAARRAYEALDNFVITRDKVDTNLPGAEERVRSNPLIQSELLRQIRDLEELGQGKITLEALCSRAKFEAASFAPL